MRRSQISPCSRKMTFSKQLGTRSRRQIGATKAGDVFDLQIRSYKCSVARCVEVMRTMQSRYEGRALAPWHGRLGARNLYARKSRDPCGMAGPFRRGSSSPICLPGTIHYDVDRIFAGALCDLPRLLGRRGKNRFRLVRESSELVDRVQQRGVYRPSRSCSRANDLFRRWAIAGRITQAERSLARIERRVDLNHNAM